MRHPTWREATTPVPLELAPVPPPVVGPSAMPPIPGSFPSGQAMAGHHLLWLAATAELPVPSEIAALMRANATASVTKATRAVHFPGPPMRSARADRWSFDSWLLLRSGRNRQVGGAALAPSYGASQAGAVVRYRLAPGSDIDPAAHVRATRAFGRDGEGEIAAGFSARPLRGVPVALYSELRLARPGSSEAELRPAVFAVTELPAADLPLGMRGEAYVQAGYVGGRFATAFVDGQARIDRAVANFDLAAVRAGAGAWGGAQKGAARLDLGPTATLDLEVGGAPARIAVDYRVRVAGEAAPGAGVAMTLSTGF